MQVKPSTDSEQRPFPMGSGGCDILKVIRREYIAGGETSKHDVETEVTTPQRGAIPLAACLAAMLLGACAHSPRNLPAVEDLPALHTPDGELVAESAVSQTHTPDMLVMTDEMKDFVDRYVSGTQRQRLQSLHRGLLSPAMIGITYESDADGTAAEVFHSGEANCLSYAHLFVAMARYAGLDARYLSTKLRPEWSRHGAQVALRRHVNVTVKLRNGEQYVVDIDPVSRERIASADVLEDRQAFALYHGNMAMDALLEQDLDRAYSQALKAIELGGDIDYLWVNLGIIYRRSGQDAEAESLYRAALEINPESRIAMNNMAVLYNSRGDTEEARVWEQRVLKRREQNPYYHYYLGEKAEAQGELQMALEHYLEAIDLKRTESEFYFRTARLYLELQDRESSKTYIEQAIEHSRLVGEREEYRAFLRKLESRSFASAQLEPL